MNIDSLKVYCRFSLLLCIVTVTDWHFEINSKLRVCTFPIKARLMVRIISGCRCGNYEYIYIHTHPTRRIANTYLFSKRRYSNRFSIRCAPGRRNSPFRYSRARYSIQCKRIVDIRQLYTQTLNMSERNGTHLLKAPLAFLCLTATPFAQSKMQNYTNFY